MSPIKSLFQSRKFWLVVLDAFTAILGLVVSVFFPEWQDFILKMWAAMQPVFLAIIVGIAVEDSAALRAGTHPSQNGD